MGHRALVAYERSDGSYNLHYSHWGGCNLRLKHTITEATPFGGECPTEEAHEAFDALAAGEDVESIVDEYGRLGSADVDLEPQAVDVTIDEAVADWLDFLHHEAFYVVDRDFEVPANRTLWFGLCYESNVVQDSSTVGHGALRTVRWYQGELVGGGYSRGEFAGLKTVIAEMVDRSMFSQDEALDDLEQTVRAEACPHAELHITRGDQ